MEALIWKFKLISPINRDIINGANKEKGFTRLWSHRQWQKRPNWAYKCFTLFTHLFCQLTRRPWRQFSLVSPGRRQSTQCCPLSPPADGFCVWWESVNVSLFLHFALTVSVHFAASTGARYVASLILHQTKSTTLSIDSRWWLHCDGVASLFAGSFSFLSTFLVWL